MTPKQVLYNRYKTALTKASINFKSDDVTCVINIYLPKSTFTVYSSKDWWENKKEGLKGRGLESLLTHINKFEVINKPCRIKEAYEKQNFIMRFLTKSFYKELTKWVH